MTHISSRLSLYCLLSALTVFVLTGCNTRADNPFRPVIAKTLQDRTYDATDDLIADAGASNIRGVPVLVGTLNHVDKLERSSTFGRLVSEQVSARLAQRGFQVSELKMRNSINIKEGIANPAESGEFLFSRDIGAIGGEHQAAVAVTGTYAVGGSEAFVNLKMIDVATGRIISASDFAVPLDGNLRALVDNEAFSFYGNSMAY